MFKKKDVALFLGAAGLAKFAQVIRQRYRSKREAPSESGSAGLFTAFSVENQENKLVLRTGTSLDANSPLSILVEGKDYRQVWQGSVQAGRIDAEFPGARAGRYRFTLSRRSLLSRGTATIGGSFDLAE